MKWLAFVVVVALGTSARAETVDLTAFEPYLMATPSGTPPAGRVRLEADASFGARTTRIFGDQAVEERLGAEVTVNRWLTVRAAGGVAVDGRGERQGEGLFTEVLVQVLERARRGVDLRVGVGYTRDYVERHVPTARVVLGLRAGRFDVVAGGNLEFHPDDSPFTREPVDVSVSLAASTRLAAGVRAGLELSGADLEGFVEADEAEGGARLVGGPTVLLAPARNVTVRATAGAIVYATDNTPAAATAPASGRAGFLGNLTLGVSFR